MAAKLTTEQAEIVGPYADYQSESVPAYRNLGPSTHFSGLPEM